MTRGGGGGGGSLIKRNFPRVRIKAGAVESLGVRVRRCS